MKRTYLMLCTAALTPVFLVGCSEMSNFFSDDAYRRPTKVVVNPVPRTTLQTNENEAEKSTRGPNAAVELNTPSDPQAVPARTTQTTTTSTTHRTTVVPNVAPSLAE